MLVCEHVAVARGRNSDEPSDHDREDAILALYRRHFGPLRSRGLRLLGDVGDAVFAADLSIVLAVDTYDPTRGTSLETWLYQWKHRDAVAEILRRREVTAEVRLHAEVVDPTELPAISNDPGPEASFMDVAGRAELKRLVDAAHRSIDEWPRLSDRHREIAHFVLERAADIGFGLAFDTPGQKGKWASELGCDRAAISHALGRIRAIVRELLSDGDEEQ